VNRPLLKPFSLRFQDDRASKQGQEVSKTLYTYMNTTRMQTIAFPPGERVTEKRAIIRPVRRLEGKIITIALDETRHKESLEIERKPIDFESFRGMVHEVVEGDFPNSIVHTKSISELIRDLPKSRSDIVVIICPLDFQDMFPRLKGALEEFRARNKTSTVVISSSHYHPESEGGRMIKQLVTENLVDRHEYLATPWGVVWDEAGIEPGKSSVTREVGRAVARAANDTHAA
jgi:hypothetical protein